MTLEFDDTLQSQMTVDRPRHRMTQHKDAQQIITPNDISQGWREQLTQMMCVQSTMAVSVDDSGQFVAGQVTVAP